MCYVAIYFLVKSVRGEITLVGRSENPVYLGEKKLEINFFNWFPVYEERHSSTIDVYFDLTKTLECPKLGPFSKTFY